MNTKLTLTLEKEIIEQAKKYASDKGRSLSEMVENYFKYITESKNESEKDQLSPRIKKLRGVLKTDTTLNYRDILDEAKNNKYGI
jgi:hemerythrin superfamily protein